ncbi:MarR family protein [Caprobacter fermentans]|uniref:MarR family protein n=1 Tax=Caproicibacter fermentans TaxID=2576756 RepID=A0A6N8I465_9FIRM|nr:helix-turn-helix domain-containing GNAT family N-acetyltransferase [Caproicibacter fermentans]MVB12759.1 MarR family protein [Caproicibacter fermentans]
MKDQKNAVSKIRSFNRFYTQLTGLLSRSILNSSFSLTEARVLLEISRMDRCTANELGARLSVDRSYMSRILKRFERDGLIVREKSERDNRIHYISLTEQGNKAMRELNRASDSRISEMIRNLNLEELQAVLDSMSVIRKEFSETVCPAEIRRFRDSDLDYVLSRHKSLYVEEYGLSSLFAGYVEQIIPGFFLHCDRQRESMWIAEIGGRPVGSIAIADAGKDTAQLRFFLLEPFARGMGLGGKLIDGALEFCRKTGYRHVYLETISDLKTAGGIYQSRGFISTATRENPEWGNDVVEERWDLDLS